jgi:3-phosphoshikimate 1-carboxyvinyltransferase
LFAALAEGESRIENFLDAGVTRVMLGALEALGVEWELNQNFLLIQGKGPGGLNVPEKDLDCGSSGTTMRLLAGALAGANVPCVMDGSSGLRTRPMDRIVNPLSEMGVPINASDGGVAPITLAKRPQGSSLQPYIAKLPVASAQVKSAILLAALGVGGTTRIEEPGPSRDHTERLLKGMGAEVNRDPQKLMVELEGPAGPLAPLRLRLPGDVSSAAFLLCAALLVPGSDITLRDVGLNPTRTGLIDVLMDMGADIEVQITDEVYEEPMGDIRVRGSNLRGIRVGGSMVVRMIDEFPIFSIAAAMAEGETVVSEAEELRFKESDRIAVLSEELKRIGVDIEERPDGFRIRGGSMLKGDVSVKGHGDHRLAMAFSIASLVAEAPIWLEDADIIDQSFPGFYGLMWELGAEVVA